MLVSVVRMEVGMITKVIVCNNMDKALYLALREANDMVKYIGIHFDKWENARKYFDFDEDKSMNVFISKNTMLQDHKSLK